MAKMNKIMPPRNTTIRGQDHLLAYITPEEAQMLMDNGGSGNAGPRGIPAFDMNEGQGGDGYGGGNNDNSSEGMNEGQDNTGIADAIGYGPSSGPSDGGASQDVRDRATAKDYGTPNPSAQDIEAARGFDVGSPTSNALAASMSRPQNTIAALQQLNRNLYDLSRREARAKSLPGVLGLIAAKNVRNLASSLVGYQPGLLDGLNVFSGNTIGPGLDPDTLAGLQSRGIIGATGKDPFGRETTGIVGFRDEYGNVAYGRDPNEDATSGGDGYQYRPQIVPVKPATGLCDAGYMFDGDMQACRLDTGFDASGEDGGVVPESGAYARMGLLDVAPTGLPEFQQQYGAGFGTPSEFTDANLAFRRRGAYRPQYFDQPYPTTGYTLLS